MERKLSKTSSSNNQNNGVRNKRKQLLINHNHDNSLTPRRKTDAKQRATQSSTNNSSNNNSKYKNTTKRILTGAGGGKIGFLIMSTTLGCMILLIFIQGSFLWAEQQLTTTSVTSSSTAQQETSLLSSLLRGGGENRIGTEQRIHMLQQFQSPNSPSTTSTTTICQQLVPDKTATSTTKLWMKSIVSILKASQHPGDSNFAYEEWTKLLLSELNPTILEQLVILLVQQIDGDGAVVQKKNEDDKEGEKSRRSSRELSISNQKSMHRILRIIQTRLAAVVASPEQQQQQQHIHSSSPPPSLPPKLRIVVVGGRTTEGLDGCHLSSIPLPDKSSMVNPSLCSWPYRLESFLNSLLGFEWVKVTNMAIEGTTTEFMIPFVKHQLYPLTNNDDEQQQQQQQQPPDIIIHAYRPSDYYNYHHEQFVKVMGSPTGSSARITGEGQPHWPPALKQKMHSELMGFLYAIETANPPLCNNDKDEEGASLPLVIHLSEEEEEELGDYVGGSSGGGTTTTTISTSYPYPDSLLSIRYKRPVQKAMQVDNKQQQQQREGEMKENNSNQTPFTMAGHMTLAWVVAFNLMEIVFKYCSSSTNDDFSSSNTAAARAKDCGTSSSCPFVFFANPTKSIGTVTKVKELNDYLQPFTVYNSGGWQVMSDMSATGYWSHKLGLVATQPKSTIIFELKNIQQDIRYFHLMTVKTGTSTGGYQQTNHQQRQGQQWSTETTIHSKARFKLQSNPNKKSKQGIETVFDIEGSHASPKHMTYPFGLDLGENAVTSGSDMMLSIELVEGSNFKILGLMLCS